jgi:hypothetical protein
MKFSLPKQLIVFFFFTSVCSAQFYDTGQDPASLRWLQIKTERFKVIFPENYGKAGIDFARSLEKSDAYLSHVFPQVKFHIPVIIHNYTVQSNGYVAWAPRRMEIYPTPEQNAVPQDPDEQLTLHEISHVYQMASLNRGLTKFLSIPFGEQVSGLVAALLPLWYLEGEAVYNESFFSQSGRGRSPDFQKELKAIAVSMDKMYGYDKIVNGSFRDFVPDHYRSGYQILALSNIKYGIGLWNKALKLTGNIPLIIDPVNISLLSNSGHTKKGLYQETIDTLAKIWKRTISLNGSKSFEVLNQSKKKNYINYHCPVKIDGDDLLAIRTSLYNPPEFVLINISGRTEKRIQMPGSLYPYYISSAKKLVVWVEDRPDPRWENRNYSVIKIMDTRTRSIKQLTWKTRYMSASISPDGNSIAAAENTPDNRNNLVLLNINNGKIIRSVPSPENTYLQRPQWSPDGEKITFITLDARGEGILSYRVKDQTWEMLIKPGHTNYQSSCLRNDTLFFVSSASGTENIYLMTPDKKVRMITNSRFGATNVFPDGGKILFTDYSASGNNICYTTLDEIPSENIDFNPSADFLIGGAEAPEPVYYDSTRVYTPVAYRKWLHPFRFHSWMPFYADLEEIQSDPLAIKPGITLLSQNTLSTVISSFGYEYDNKRHKFHSRITLNGWLPVLESRIDYGDLPVISKLGSHVSDPAKPEAGLTLTNRLSVPLTFSRGKYHQFISPSVSAIYNNYYIYLQEDSLYDYGQTQFSGRLYFSNYHTSAIRDIYPRWAQIIDLNFSFYPFDNNIYGSIISLRCALYMPGFVRNNGIRIRYENEIKPTKKVPLFNRIGFPRGYKNIISDELSYFSLDYVFPLVYPDFNILSLTYITRIRTGFFFDYANGNHNYYLKPATGGYTVDYINNFNESFSSYGGELMADFYLFRLPYMISAGVQASWLKNTKTPVLEFVFNLDLFGFNIGRTSGL